MDAVYHRHAQDEQGVSRETRFEETLALFFQKHAREKEETGYFRLPPSARLRICELVVGKVKPIRLNTSCFDKDVWLQDDFTILSAVFSHLSPYLQVSFAFRADMLTALLLDTTLHATFSPFIGPRFNPLATEWLNMYGCYAHNIAIEVDFSTLGCGADLGAALLWPNVEHIEDLLVRFVESQLGRSEASPLQSLVLLCRRFFGRRDFTVLEESTNGRSSSGWSSNGRSSHGCSSNDRSSDCCSSNDQSISGQSSNGQSPSVHSISGHSTNGQSPGGQSFSGHSISGQSITDQSIIDQSIIDQSIIDQSIIDQPSNGRYSIASFYSRRSQPSARSSIYERAASRFSIRTAVSDPTAFFNRTLSQLSDRTSISKRSTLSDRTASRISDRTDISERTSFTDWTTMTTPDRSVSQLSDSSTASDSSTTSGGSTVSDRTASDRTISDRTVSRLSDRATVSYRTASQLSDRTASAEDVYSNPHSPAWDATPSASQSQESFRRIDSDYSSSAPCSTSSWPQDPSISPDYCPDSWLTLCNHLLRLKGRVDSIRMCGFSETYTTRFIGTMFPDAWIETKKHSYRVSPSTIWPKLSGQKSYVDVGDGYITLDEHDTPAHEDGYFGAVPSHGCMQLPPPYLDEQGEPCVPPILSEMQRLASPVIRAGTSMSEPVYVRNRDDSLSGSLDGKKVAKFMERHGKGKAKSVRRPPGKSDERERDLYNALI